MYNPVIRMDHRQLAYARGRLLAAIGITSVFGSACGGLVVFVQDDDGAGGSGGSTTASKSSASSTTIQTVGSSTSGCPMIEMVPIVCVPEPAGGCQPNTSTAAEEQVTAYIAATCIPSIPELCGCFADSLDLLCGPFTQHGGDCCYYADYNLQEVCEGRPFAVAGEARVAPATRRSDWSARAAVDITSLSAVERAALAAAWTKSGQAEHASVASFARVVLELVALGAPADLVALAQGAGADELRHAELCFGIAAALTGEPVGPGPLEIGGALRSDVASIVHATVVEGCIGETLSALLALAARDAATDAAVAAALERIAEDEQRHAELAWRTVAWAIESDLPGARDAAIGAFAQPVALEGEPVDVRPEIARAFGVLPEADRSVVIRDALAKVIGPSRDALLARRRDTNAVDEDAVGAC